MQTDWLNFEEQLKSSVFGLAPYDFSRLRKMEIERFAEIQRIRFDSLQVQWVRVYIRNCRSSLTAQLATSSQKRIYNLHQERQSQELHSQIVSKSDCSLPVPAFLLAISSDHQELLTKLLLVLSGQFGTHFLGQQRPSGRSFHVVHNLNNFLIIYVM